MAIYRTRGSCSREIIFSVNGEDVLTELKFLGGYSDNLQAVSRLVVGKKIDEVISALKGIQCRNGTSCPDQLATALEDYKEKKQV